MQRREFTTAAAGALALAAFPARWTSAAAPRRKLLMFTKSAGFEHSSIRREGDKLSHAEQTLTELGKQHDFDVIATKDGRVFDGDLDQYDAFFFYTTGNLTEAGNDKTPPMSVKGKERLIAAIEAGKGFLASHCGSDTFHSVGPSREEQEKRDPYIAMLGGEFISHGPQQESRQIVASPDFPGAKGLEDPLVITDEWYSLKNFADDMHVILVQDTRGMDGKDYERPPYPSTWARQHGKGRVFYTSMGHREDVWTNAKFQQLLLGGLSWSFGNVEFKLTANITERTPGAHVMPPA